MDFIKKNWQLGIAIVSSLFAVYSWIYNNGAKSASLESRVFDSPEQKVYTVKTVEDMPSPLQVQGKFLRDSIKEIQQIKKDSLFILQMKKFAEKDSLSRLNADQIYQMKEEIKFIVEDYKTKH